MEIKLTETVQKGGCAAKIAARELRHVLGLVKFPPVNNDILVDGRDFDDAAVWQIGPDQAIVQTLDFFTPIVDSPYYFGGIAAANALSDVYAMGGQPRTALAILAYPLATLPDRVIAEVMQGASDVLTSAQVSLVGGHSIDDDTLKFGLSVSGEVHPQKIWQNNRAMAGDRLILTKPLGTGTLTAALKRRKLDESALLPMLKRMVQPNDVMRALTPELASVIKAATDITGFGLLGHALHIARASQVRFAIDWSALPLYSGALNTIAEGFLTKAHRTNREYTEEYCDISALLADQQLMLFDPQTSGGLLLAVSEEAASEICSSLRQVFPEASIIGQVEELDGASCYLTVKHSLA